MLSSSLSAAPLELTESPSGDLVLRLRLDLQHGRHVLATETDGSRTHELAFPELPARLTSPAGVELPFAAHLIAAPPGAGVELEVVEARFEELEGILLPPAPRSAETSRPSGLVESEYLGILRGVDAYGLRLFPVSYDPGLQRLSVCTDLRVAVRFSGGRRFKPAADSPGPSPLYGAFLNPPAGMPPRAAAKSARLDGPGDWYDPALPWVKVRVAHDGVFRIDRRWLAARSVDAGEIDPRTLRLFHLGSEQPLRVFGQEDGSFDESDYLLFVGRFRRDKTPEEGGKDFESIYGRENFYWLTWGGEAGRRFQPESAEPDSGYPVAQFYWTTAHFEEDLWFQVFADAPDIIRDHWFWRRRPIRGVDVDTPGSAVFTGELSAPVFGEEEYGARLRVALHGQTPAHHTVIKLNNHHVGDYHWQGQIEFEIEEEIPSTYLRRGTNRLLVQAFASATEGRDQTLFNYFAIDYRSRYAAKAGYLRFTRGPSTGTQFVAFDFSHPEIHLFDTAREIVFSGMLIDSTRAPLYTAIFEDENDTGAEYVIVDSAGIRTPRGVLDSPSRLRTAHPGADYLVISHEDFLDAAERLAGHRRDSGLAAAVVDVEDVYDEFSHGLMLREAIGAFISHAYHNWERPPQYVLLFGDATFDYRNILGGGHPSYVPTLYYDARRRGNSPSDYLYSLVDGDDLLPDVAVGRLAVETAVEAEGVVDKIVGYDTEPAPGDWRSRVIYVANHHPKNEFTRPSDELASRFSEPFGLQSVKIYNPDEEHLPNPTGKAFLDALNAGALLVNFNGHGAAGTMQYVFSLQFPDWDYLSQVDNGPRLPLVTALSCLNGMFVNPHTEAIGEVFTDRAGGGSIAYISASAQSFTSQNDLLGQQLFGQFFTDGTLAFGPALNAAKAQVLAAHPSWTAAALTMQLFGDPAQELALPLLPDYQPRELTTGEELLAGGIVPVAAVLANNTRATRDSVTVLVAARGEATDDTLYLERLAPFVGSRRLSFDWRIGDRRGEHLLEVVLDPEDLVAELDEGNNAVAAAVDILSSVVPELLFPPAGAVLPVAAASFEAVFEGEGGQVEFQLSTTGDFAANSSVSPAVEAEDGIAVFAPALPEGPWFWRARAVDGAVPGPWSATRSLRLSEEASVPGERLRWGQTAVQMAAAGLEFLELDGGLLRVSRSSTPLRPGSATREDGYTVRGLKGAGVLVTDGTYLYAKRWFNDSSTIYPGTDFFTRIGTGLNGSVRARNYGVFGDSTTAGISATCHGDGYIYSESSRAFELERISLATGRLDTVAVPDGLLEWRSGEVEDGHSLITSDGEFVYNVAMSAESGMRTAWGVRVFDPADGWRLLREFTSPPTETGFTFEWTDGILADGERLYFIEFGGERRVRMVDAFDGGLIDEWMSDQDTTRVITGQYDWVNNKAWLGDLRGSAVFRYSGTGIPATGAARSGPIGPAERWHSMEVAASGAVAIDVQAAGEDGPWSKLPGFSGLTPGAVDLSAIDAARHPLLRLRATLSDTTREGAAAALDRWEVVWEPAPDLKAIAAAVEPDGSGFAADVSVRNLSPFAVTGAVVELLAGGSAIAGAARTLPALERGAAGEVRIELPGQPEDFPVVARVLIPGRSDATPGDNTILLPVEPKTPRFSARRWPAGEPFLHGDPLLPGQALFIRGPFVESGRILLAVDGTPRQPDSTFSASPDSGVRVLFRPELPPGRHQLQVRLFSGDREIGSEILDIVVAEELALANVLVHPHPVRERTAFTYVLSHEAEVSVELFSLSGRRVARLGPQRQEAGFRQLEWDGRDADGGLVANGTYLYLIEAAAGNRKVRQRGPLVIVR